LVLRSRALGEAALRRKSAEPEVLFDGELADDTAPLGDMPHAEAGDVLGAQAREPRLILRDPSGAGAHEAADAPEQRRLASPVCTEDRGDLARLGRNDTSRSAWTA